MSAMSSSSTKHLLKEYHRLAAETLLGERSTNIDEAVLSAAENGHYERMVSLLSQKRSAVNARCHMSGDTPIIAAARNGHQSIVKLLLGHGADVTLQNDQGENSLDVASPQLKKVILNSIQHEDRAMTNAQALLQSAWLGDAVSVKKYLSGNHYLDVNCHNSDRVTPLLLVTRDIKLFDKVQSAIENNYDPVEVMQNLLDNHADINVCDKKGQSALHLVANSESVHARKMVSLLMRNGSSVDAVDSEEYSPLHVASGKGHTAIIVALVEEGGADVNLRGGERGDTPLILSARGGHSEAARYLLAKGADVTAIDENGDSALSVAKTPSLVKLLKEAWVEQTQSNQGETAPSNQGETAPSNQGETAPSDRTNSDTSLSNTPSEDRSKGQLSSPHPLEQSTHTPVSHSDHADEMHRDFDDSSMSPRSLDQLSGNSQSFFITARQLSKSLADLDESDHTDVENTLDYNKLALGTSVPFFPVSEAEADDEAETEYSGHRRTKPATRRAHIRANFEESITKRKVGQERREGGQSLRSPKHSAGGNTKTHSLPRHMTHNYAEMNACSSADEDHMTHGNHGNKESRSKGRGENSGHRGNTRSVSTFSGRKSRPAKLPLRHGAIDPEISRSHDSLAGVINEPKRQEKKSSFLPQVVMSPSVAKKSRVSPKQKAAPEKLPSLTGMQAVALVSVDTDRERLKVHKFTPANEPTVVLRRKDRQSNITRSKSLMSVRQNSKEQPPQLSEGLTFGHTKRNSTGSVIMQQLDQQSLMITKVPLLPSVVTPQFGTPGGFAGKQRGPTHHSKGPGRLQPLSVVSPTSPSVKKMTNLSNINEDTESSSLEKTLTRTRSLSEVTGGSKDSTLKASSHSDFESDSLEHHSVVMSRTGLASGCSNTNGDAAMRFVNHQVTEMNIVPPTPRRNAGAQQSNVVVNYATKDGSIPLSPIWNRMQYLRSDSETSTNSEYITSYIGRLTPLPHVQAPYPGDWKVGADSGHGESNDEDHGEGGSSQESGSEEEELEREGKADRECLKWKRGRLLGKGAYGKVWEGLMDSAKMIAVKEVEIDCENPERAQSQYEKIQIEVEILRSLKHKNVVSYLGTSMELGIVYIFMEFISGGSLHSILKRFGPLDSRTIAHYTRQITRALDYLHSNAIIHRDIKGANIMVTSRGVVKLIDFGCAKKYCQDGTGGMHSVRGTPYWMAPEVICGLGYGRKSDIWSLGCTVHEMATTKPPWADFPPEAAMFQIGIGKAVPPPPDHLSKKLVAFFYKCLTRDPTQRPNATELLEDEFLASMKKDSTSQP